MKFDSRDIERVAKGRVNDRENKTINTVNVGVMVGTIVGWVCRMFYPNANLLSWGIITIAGIVFVYYWLYQLPKKQKVYTSQLWAEYQKELKEVKK